MKYCPDCETEYMDTATRCSDCGIPLIDETTWKARIEPDNTEREQLREDDLESLCSVNGPVEARSIMNAMEQEEIPAVLHSFHETAFDGLFVSPKGWGEILVANSHLREALELLKQLEDFPPAPLEEGQEPPAGAESTAEDEE